MKRRLRPRSMAACLVGAFAIFTKQALADGPINLSQFQEISGFPINCENAYNAPITGCSQSDFSPANAPCSQACFNGLESITTDINNACGGLSADPSTLIGLFFNGKGAQALCPSVSGGGSGGAATSIIGATTLPPSQPSLLSDPPPPAAASTSVAAVSTATAAASSTSAAVSTAASSSATETFILSSGTASASATVRPFTSTAGASSMSAAVAGTETNSPAQTTGPGSFGGGAIPFTVNNSNDAVRMSQSMAVATLSAVAAAVCCVLTALA